MRRKQAICVNTGYPVIMITIGAAADADNFIQRRVITEHFLRNVLRKNNGFRFHQCGGWIAFFK